MCYHDKFFTFGLYGIKVEDLIAKYSVTSRILFLIVVIIIRN